MIFTKSKFGRENCLRSVFSKNGQLKLIELRPPIHPRIKREDLAGNMIEARQEGDGAGGVGGRVEAAEDVLGADFLAAFVG